MTPLLPEEVRLVHGIPCTVAERATFDAARIAPSLVEAVVAVDMAAQAELCSITRVRACAERHPGWRGARQLRAALVLADENSWSPNETRTRMVWRLEAHLPAPLVNRPLFDLRGRLLGYPDLLDPESGLVVEYDGADHRRAARHAGDVGREHAFRTHGLEVTHVTGPDLRTPGLVRARILESRERALWLPESDRRWTVTPPPSWRLVPSLEVRLVVQEMQRRSAAD